MDESLPLNWSMLGEIAKLFGRPMPLFDLRSVLERQILGLEGELRGEMEVGAVLGNCRV